MDCVLRCVWRARGERLVEWTVKQVIPSKQTHNTECTQQPDGAHGVHGAAVSVIRRCCHFFEFDVSSELTLANATRQLPF